MFEVQERDNVYNEISALLFIGTKSECQKWLASYIPSRGFHVLIEESCYF